MSIPKKPKKGRPKKEKLALHKQVTLNKLDRSLIYNLMQYTTRPRNSKIHSENKTLLFKDQDKLLLQGWKTRRHITETNDNTLDRYKFTSDYSNIQTRLNKLNKLGLVKIKNHHFKDNRKRPHRLKMYHLLQDKEGDSFRKLFLYIFNSYLTFEFISSDYYKENLNIADNLIKSFINDLGISKFISLKNVNGENLSETEVLAYFPALFYLYLTDKEWFLDLYNNLKNDLAESNIDYDAPKDIYVTLILFASLIDVLKDIRIKSDKFSSDFKEVFLKFIRHEIKVLLSKLILDIQNTQKINKENIKEMEVNR